MFKFSRTWIKNIIVRRALQWKINIAWSLHVSHSLIILKKHRIKKKPTLISLVYLGQDSENKYIGIDI